jgi:hypothetical protein
MSMTTNLGAKTLKKYLKRKEKETHFILFYFTISIVSNTYSNKHLGGESVE